MPSRGDILLARYCFTSRITEPVCLPSYKGSALRGGLGHMLRRIACPASALGATVCHLGNRCPYHYLFEPSPPENSSAFLGQTSVPQPFVIEPPLESKTEYAPGDSLVFHLTLVGLALEYLPYFIVAFEELGRQGIGRGRGRYRLVEVAFVDPLGQAVPIYGVDRQLEDVSHLGYTCVDLAASRPVPVGQAELTLHFVTPTRMKFEDRLCDRPSFVQLYGGLARRQDLMAYLHCGGRWGGQQPEEMELAGSVETAGADLKWMDWRRYSNRQREAMYLGGFVGSVTFRGDFEPFWSRLLLGEYLHLGKAATFGLGQYTFQIGGLQDVEIQVAVSESALAGHRN